MNLMSKILNYSEKYHDYQLDVNFEHKWVELTVWTKRDEDDRSGRKIEFTVQNKHEALELIEVLQKLVNEFPDTL